MKRRAGLIALAASAACVACPLRGSAQSRSNVRRLGVLRNEPAEPFSQAEVNAFLRGRGWIVGETLLIEPRFADWRVERFPELVDDLLLRFGADVLLSFSNEGTAAAARATRTTPIVFSYGFLPLECGLIDSYARPGRNVTGVASGVGIEWATKRLEFLRAAAPSARRLSFMSSDLTRFTLSGGFPPGQREQVVAAATALGFEPQFHVARYLEDVEGVLGEAVAARAQAIAVSGAVYNHAPGRVVEFALRQRWPSTTFDKELFEAGLLMHYGLTGADYAWLSQRVGDMVDRTLRGVNPAEMPVEIHSRYGLSLNLKTARALGLTLPQSLVLRAERVIE